MQESVHRRLFTAATFTWRAKLFIECRMIDPKMVSQICCFPTVRYCLPTLLTYSVIILQQISARVLLKPKVLLHGSTLICRGNYFLDFVRRHLKIMPRVVVQRSQIITKSVMLTIGNLENLHDRLVYRLTIAALICAIEDFPLYGIWPITQHYVTLASLVV